jgi:membrane protease YdiL (CAAX protease family)
MTTSRSGPAEGSSGTGRTYPGTRPAPLLIERTVLDQQVALARDADPRPWGVISWLGPLLTLAAIIAAGQLVIAAAARRGGLPAAVGIGMTAAAEGLMLVALLAFGRRIAARGGGWRTALGLDRIRAGDWAPWGLGLGFMWAGRTVVGLLANALSEGRATAEASNLHVGRPGPAEVVGLVLIVVLLAPVTEELMFRGLLLRSFMHRLSFWPAASISTVLFAVFHVYEVRTALGAITLACSVGVIGLGNCYLVRITGRLTPGIMVHASFNAVGLAIAVLLAHR